MLEIATRDRWNFFLRAPVESNFPDLTKLKGIFIFIVKTKTPSETQGVRIGKTERRRGKESGKGK